MMQETGRMLKIDGTHVNLSAFDTAQDTTTDDEPRSGSPRTERDRRPTESDELQRLQRENRLLSLALADAVRGRSAAEAELNLCLQRLASLGVSREEVLNHANGPESHIADGVHEGKQKFRLFRKSRRKQNKVGKAATVGRKAAQPASGSKVWSRGSSMSSMLRRNNQYLELQPADGSRPTSPSAPVANAAAASLPDNSVLDSDDYTRDLTVPHVSIDEEPPATSRHDDEDGGDDSQPANNADGCVNGSSKPDVKKRQKSKREKKEAKAEQKAMRKEQKRKAKEARRTANKKSLKSAAAEEQQAEDDGQQPAPGDEDNLTAAKEVVSSQQDGVLGPQTHAEDGSAAKRTPTQTDQAAAKEEKGQHSNAEKEEEEEEEDERARRKAELAERRRQRNKKRQEEENKVLEEAFAFIDELEEL